MHPTSPLDLPAPSPTARATTTDYNLGSDAPSFAVGLDLGQATDFSALAVVEHVHVLPPDVSLADFAHRLDAQLREPLLNVLPPATPELHVRHLQRWELGTPYHAIVDDVCALMATDALWGARLYFDRSGVGRAVGDLLYAAYYAGRVGGSVPRGITITGAEKATPGGGRPKRDLMTSLQLPIQQGRFRIAQGVPLGDVLERELTGFKLRLANSGHASFDIGRREGEGHGDLVIACALAVIDAPFGVRPRVVEASR